MRGLILIVAAIAVSLLLSTIPAEAWDARLRIQAEPGATDWTAHVVVDDQPAEVIPLLNLTTDSIDSTIVQADALGIAAGQSFTFRVQAIDGPNAGVLSNSIGIACDDDLIPCTATTSTSTTSSTTSTSTTTSTTTTTLARCDINGDGMIGASDALAILQAAVGVRPNLCEVNGD